MNQPVIKKDVRSVGSAAEAGSEKPPTPLGQDLTQLLQLPKPSQVRLDPMQTRLVVTQEGLPIISLLYLSYHI